jgi:glycosyltransferase involved in cell wall biosynthesis
LGTEIPKLSVIVSSRKSGSASLHERNIRKTVGCNEIEYLPILNPNGELSICSAYNRGVEKARGEILVFVHDDVFFMECGWGSVLMEKFKDRSIGLVGVAGTEYLFADNPGWVVAGRPFIHGHVVHELHNGEVYNLTVFSWDKKDTDVVAVDGLFFAVRAGLFPSIAFDDSTFDGFHFYDLDICMQVRKTHRCIVTWDVLLKHQSGGEFDENWRKYASRFIGKYRSELPASCATAVPDLSRRIDFENYNLKGRAPQVTIS